MKIVPPVEFLQPSFRVVIADAGADLESEALDQVVLRLLGVAVNLSVSAPATSRASAGTADSRLLLVEAAPSRVVSASDVVVGSDVIAFLDRNGHPEWTTIVLASWSSGTILVTTWSSG